MGTVGALGGGGLCSGSGLHPRVAAQIQRWSQADSEFISPPMFRHIHRGLTVKCL